MQRGSIFSDDFQLEERLIHDEKRLGELVTAVKTLGLKVALTSGSFDLPHIGHMRYLRAARLSADFLVVGIDSDNKVRSRKGKNRPIVPELERAEMIAHTRYADLIFIKDVADEDSQFDGNEQHSLIKLVRPDILIISERTGYDDEVQKKLLEFCGEVVNLPSQAETSTSARIRRVQTEVLQISLEEIEATVLRIKTEMGILD